MRVLCKSLNLCCRITWLSLFGTVLSAVLPVVAHAQTDSKATALFQYASLSGIDKTITATRVPVTTAGRTTYKDVTLQFDVDADGNLTLSVGYPTIVSSPEVQVSSFRAGTYAGPKNIANGKAIVTVGGPGVSGGGGSSWSLLASGDADKCTYPGSATWYVGPLENSPQAARLKKAGITSTAWSYGVSGVGPSYSCLSDRDAYHNWENGSLIGVSQSGNTLTVASFTYWGTDKSAPVDQITYVLTQ